MKIAIGILVAAGLVGLVYWWYTKGATNVPVSTGSSGSPTSGGLLSSVKSMVANRDATPGGSSPFSASNLFTPSGIVESHVARKDAVAPYVLQKFGVPGSVAQPIASIAGKLDVSGYAENYIGSKVGGVFSKIGL